MQESKGYPAKKPFRIVNYFPGNEKHISHRMAKRKSIDSNMSKGEKEVPRRVSYWNQKCPSIPFLPIPVFFCPFSRKTTRESHPLVYQCVASVSHQTCETWVGNITSPNSPKRIQASDQETLPDVKKLSKYP